MLGMTFEEKVEEFIKELQDFKKMDNVFNPWQDYDKAHDLDKESSEKRRENLSKYIKERKDVKYILIAEAPGYQGCHFSGIPMTSERLILDDKNNTYGLKGLKRTSDYHEQNNKLAKAKIYTTRYKEGKNIAKTVIKNGFTEPTATIVWKQMVDVLRVSPTNFVLWNAFPFHPWSEKYGILSNRMPNKNEIKDTKDILSKFISLFDEKEEIICIGNTSHNTLSEILKIDSYKGNKVHHPANGGAKDFRNEIQALISSHN